MIKKASEVQVGESFRFPNHNSMGGSRQASKWYGPVKYVDLPPHCIEGNVILNYPQGAFELNADDSVEAE